jgi:hypothetical protein
LFETLDRAFEAVDRSQAVTLVAGLKVSITLAPVHSTIASGIEAAQFDASQCSWPLFFDLALQRHGAAR